MSERHCAPKKEIEELREENNILRVSLTAHELSLEIAEHETAVLLEAIEVHRTARKAAEAEARRVTHGVLWLRTGIIVSTVCNAIMILRLWAAALCLSAILVTSPLHAGDSPYIVVKAIEVQPVPQQNCVGGFCRVPRRQASGPALLSCNGVAIAEGVGTTGDPGRWVLTVAHIFHRGTNPSVYSGGRDFRADVISNDYARDVSLLWVSGLQCDVVPLAKQDPPVGSIGTMHVFDLMAGPIFVEPNGVIEMSGYSTTGIARWKFCNRVRNGWSGGAVTYQGELVGLQSSGDPEGLPRLQIRPATEYQAGLIVQRESIEKFLRAADPGLLESVKSQELPAKKQEQEPKSQELEAELLIDRAAERDKALFDAIVGLNGKIEQMQPSVPPAISQPEPSPVPSTPGTPPVEQRPTTDAPGGTLTDRAKEWAWDTVSASGWAWVGAAVAGPIGLALPFLGGFIHRRLKNPKRGGDPSSPPGGGTQCRWQPDLQGGQRVPTPASPPPADRCQNVIIGNYFSESELRDLVDSSSPAPSDPPAGKSVRIPVDQIKFPTHAQDYSKVWTDHMFAAGVNPINKALKLSLYVEAFDAADKGVLTLPGVENQRELIASLRRWINREFSQLHESLPNNNNIHHKAFYAFLHEKAVSMIRQGTYQQFPELRDAADAIEDWVDARLVDRQILQGV